MRTSVILPCYNPAAGWEQHVYRGYTDCCMFMEQTPEFVVVFDGVTTGVTEQEKGFLIRHIPDIKLIAYPENRGKGFAIREGMRAASGDILIYTDVDFPYTGESIRKVYEEISRQRCDLAVGVKDRKYYSHVPPARRLLSRGLRFLIRVLFSIPITDTQCGLKGFRREMLPLFLDTKVDRYLFDLEFIRKSYGVKKYTIHAVEISLRENITFSKMTYRILYSEFGSFFKIIFGK